MKHAEKKKRSFILIHIHVSPALKKPAITPQKHMEPAEAEAMLKEVRAGFGAGAGAGARPGDDLARGEPLDRPDLPHDENLNLGNNDMPLQQQLPNPVIDKPMLFDKDNKAVIKADEFGEQRRQLGGQRSCFIFAYIAYTFQLLVMQDPDIYSHT